MTKAIMAVAAIVGFALGAGLGQSMTKGHGDSHAKHLSAQ
jgi:hypothetical protein